MPERMIITDVSRMLSGACIAGYSADLSRPIRPVRATRDGGLDWTDLRVARGALLAPFNVVDVELGDPQPDPPHCEDVILKEPLHIEYAGVVPHEKIPVALDRIAFDSASDAFGGRIQDARSIPPGAGERSLATVRAKYIDFLTIDLDNYEKTLKFRITFRDAAGDEFNLPVTDIGYRSYCHYQLAKLKRSPGRIGAVLRERLNHADAVYIRIGASRPFQPSPGKDEACFLLATGVYSVPEYRAIPWPELFPDELPPEWNPLPDDIVVNMENQRRQQRD